MDTWIQLKKFFGSSLHLDGRSGAKYIEILRTKFLMLPDESSTADPAGTNAKNKNKPDKFTRPRTPVQKACYEQLKEILSNYDGNNAKWEDTSFDRKDTTIWSDAYECDRLLVALYNDDQVKLELERRIVLAQEHKLEFASFFEARLHVQTTDQQPSSKEQKKLNRILLGQIIERQQWYDNQLYLKRQYASAAQKRVAFTFFVSLTIFGGMLMDHFNSDKIFKQPGPKPSTENIRAIQMQEQEIKKLKSENEEKPDGDDSVRSAQ